MRRVVLVVAALAAGAVAPVAGASATSCLVLSDPAGDATVVRPLTVVVATTPTVQDDPALDVTQAVLEVRDGILVGSLTVGRSTSKDSFTWSLDFGDGEVGYALHAYQHVDGIAFSAFGPGSDTSKRYAGPADGVVDLTRGRVEVSVPLRVLGVDRHARFTTYAASTARSIGSNSGTGPQSSSVSSADMASGSRSYRLDRGCTS